MQAIGNADSLWADAERLDDGRYRLRWQCPSATRVDVSVATRPDGVEESNVSVTFEKTDSDPVTAVSTIVEGLDPARRYYFSLRGERGELTRVSERRLPLQGAPNLRDLGGYRTADGEQLRWGRLFRSGRLSELTDADCRYIRQLDIGAVCDFRQREESEAAPTDLGQGSRHTICALPIVPGDFGAAAGGTASAKFTSEQMFDAMRRVYVDLVRNQQPAYRALFDQLLDAGERAVLFHCSAGKDRTGFAAALILSALGVPRETVFADYLLTARYYPPPSEEEYLRRKYSSVFSRAADPRAIAPFIEVRREYLETALALIDTEYGGVDRYLANELGVNESRRRDLRDRFIGKAQPAVIA